jgi:hypothetical protein
MASKARLRDRRWIPTKEEYKPPTIAVAESIVRKFGMRKDTRCVTRLS